MPSINSIQETPNGGFPPIYKKNKINKSLLVKAAGYKKTFISVSDIMKKNAANKSSN